MTIAERAEAYARTFPTRPPLRRGQEGGADVIYGTWVCGADYRTRSTLYGAYPHGYLPRVLALFPDAGDEVLHAFSGALEPGPYTRLDLIDRCRVPDLRFRQASVYDAATVFEGRRPFNVVIADPPYSKADAAMYGTPTLHRGRATRALAPVTRVGGHLVWLDQVWPMHRKADWRTVGRITLVRSTNHRVRLVSIFERVST